MRSFIYDTWGYYPEDENAISFSFRDWDFSLEATDVKEDEANSLNQFIHSICGTFHIGAELVKTRNQKLLATYDEKSLGLVGVSKGQWSLDTLRDFQALPISSKTAHQYMITYLESLWEEKMILMEEKCLAKIKLDEFLFRLTMENAILALGLASNAIQYLNDTKFDFGDEIKNLVYAHKRLTSKENFSFFNPLNLILDSKGRDLAELYKREVISLQELLDYLKINQLELQDLAILMARAMFPTTLFDYLEDNMEGKKEIRRSMIQYHQKIDNVLKRTKELHKALVSIYKIRPIEWLLK